MDWQDCKAHGFGYKNGKYILPQYLNLSGRNMVDGVHRFERLGKFSLRTILILKCNVRRGYRPCV